MADLDENLITFLKADATVAAITEVISINRVPENKTPPYIWIQLDDEFDETDLGGSGGTPISVFDIECTSEDLDESKDLQTAVKAALHGHTGSFGDQVIAWAEVTGKDDTYETRQQFGDDKNLHVSALTLEIGTDSRS